MRPVPERLAALVAGERFYTTGKPCRNGHVGKRAAKTGVCCACASQNSLRCMAKTPEHPARIAARALGEPRYATGAPCRNGHDALRYTSSGQCVICATANHRGWLSRRPGIEARWARERRGKDPSGHRAEVMRWARKNPGLVKAMLAAWKKANPERAKDLARAGTQTRRARRIQNGGRFTADDIADLLAQQQGRCAACAVIPERLEIDHVVPVKHGGSSDPSNLQLLCRPCNRSKGSLLPDEWEARRRALLYSKADLQP